VGTPNYPACSPDISGRGRKTAKEATEVSSVAFSLWISSAHPQVPCDISVGFSVTAGELTMMGPFTISAIRAKVCLCVHK
jgi:hypothetical protein